MKFAVIQTSGSQYKISQGQEIELDNLNKEKGDKIEFSKVLLLVDKDKIVLGKPFIKNCKVKGEIIENYKGKKIRVAKYKAKSRYRKVKGYRHQHTKVLIKKISL